MRSYASVIAVPVQPPQQAVAKKIKFRADVPIPPLKRLKQRFHPGYLCRSLWKPDFLDFPLEVRLQIYGYVLEAQAGPADQPSRRSHHGRRIFPFWGIFRRPMRTFTPQFRGGFGRGQRPLHHRPIPNIGRDKSGLRKDIANLALSHSQIRDEICDLIGRSCVMENVSSSYGSIMLLSHHLTFGKYNCRITAQLELGMSVDLRYHEQYWGQYLSFFTKMMPNLIYFKLFSNERPSWGQTTPRWNHSSVAFERRPKLQFLSFLVLRHPKLDRLILPALRGPPWRDDELTGYDFLIAEKSYDQRTGDKRFLWEQLARSPGSDSGPPVTYHDEVLNATALRRLTYNELLRINVQDYIIRPAPGIHATKDDIWTLNPFDHEHEYFKRVDELGNTHEDIFKVDKNGKNIGHDPNPVDRLIREGRRNRKKVRQNWSLTPAEQALSIRVPAVSVGHEAFFNTPSRQGHRPGLRRSNVCGSTSERSL